MQLLNILENRIRWTDLDAYGHLNNAVFFDFMTEARAELLKEVLKNKDLCQFVTIHVECDFKIPYFYPDTAIVKQYCEQIGNSSFTLKYEFYSQQQPQRLHAQGQAKMVAYDPTTKRPTRVPELIVHLLQKEYSLGE